MGVGDEDDFSDGGLAEVGFDVFVGDAGVSGVVGPVPLDQAFD